MAVWEAAPLRVVRPALRSADGSRWQICAHLNPICRPDLGPDQFVAAVLECRLYAEPPRCTAHQVEAPFRLEWIYLRGGRLRSAERSACHLPVLLTAPLSDPAPAMHWQADPGSRVQGAAAGPRRDDLRAAVTLLVASGPP